MHNQEDKSKRQPEDDGVLSKELPPQTTTTTTETIESGNPMEEKEEQKTDTHDEQQKQQADLISLIKQPQQQQPQKPIELRLLVRRREAGALIGKRGNNIKRLRDQYKQSSSFSIPDTGNGPERVVCIYSRSWLQSMELILQDLTKLLLEKSPNEDEQTIELKMLIHSLHAGSIIGLGGQSIKKLRTVSVVCQS